MRLISFLGKSVWGRAGSARDLCLGGILNTNFELSMIHTALSRAEYGKYV